MAEALISRLPHGVIVSDIRRERIDYLKKKYKVKEAKTNLDAFERGEIVVLAVKPQNVA